MKHILNKSFIKSSIFIFILSFLFIGMSIVFASEDYIVTSVDEMTTALMNARDGDTILVGDIIFEPMPMGMILVSKNVTIKSGKDTNAKFTNATFALKGTTSNLTPLAVTFENIDFCGDQSGTSMDLNSPPSISSEMPEVMKTMCATIFKMNVNATYTGCSFEGYHYGYGGVFNAIYSSDDYENVLNLMLDDCSFRNNISKYGGSIYLFGYGHNINLDARHCVFDNNTAATGGAIWAQDADVSLTDCSFINNRYLHAEVDEPNGGALSLYNCATELDGCLIACNESYGEGAGIFCEISPFKTLIMENCTVFGNTSLKDEGISVSILKTNFNTPAIVHIYFSSLFGKQNIADKAELFGCLLVDQNIVQSEPKEENGYCLELMTASAQEKGLIPETPKHVSLLENKYQIPKDLSDKIAGGKFSKNSSKRYVADNYVEETTIEIEYAPGHTKCLTARYGDEIVLGIPERKGYSFDGWEYTNGTVIENNTFFNDGELLDRKIIARWHFVFLENLYIIWIPILIIVSICLIVFVFNKRKKKTASVTASTIENIAKETTILSDDWIDQVHKKPEINELLSKREIEVLQKLLEGKGRRQIADELFVTEATIKKHSASIYSKLGVHSRTELIYKLTKQ